MFYLLFYILWYQVMWSQSNGHVSYSRNFVSAKLQRMFYFGPVLQNRKVWKWICFRFNSTTIMQTLIHTYGKTVQFTNSFSSVEIPSSYIWSCCFVYENLQTFLSPKPIKRSQRNWHTMWPVIFTLLYNTIHHPSQGLFYTTFLLPGESFYVAPCQSVRRLQYNVDSTLT